MLWVGKAGTFALMFAYPAFLLGDGTAAWQGPMRVVGWVIGLIGLGLPGWAGGQLHGPAARRCDDGPSGARSSV